MTENAKTTWIAAAALCITIVSGMYSLTVAPLKEITETATEGIEAIEKRVDSLEKNQFGLQVELKYIKESLDRIEEAVVEEK